jgi:hypothetical protein
MSFDSEVDSLKDIKYKMEKELNSVKNMHKEKKAEWRLKEQEMQSQISIAQNKQSILEKKIKELETIMVSNKSVMSGK